MSEERGEKKGEKYRDLSERLLQFAARIIRVAAALPKSDAGQVIRGQMLASGTSVGANYEEACGAESRSDFVHKMRIVLKELRETRYWLRLILAAEFLPKSRLAGICAEADELVAIMVKSVKTARGTSDAKN
jgi:four helix bundle protein